MNIEDILNEVEQVKKEITDPNKLLGTFSYSLTYSEALHCLKNAGLYKTSGKRAIVYTVLMIIAAVGFFVSYIVRNDINWLIFAVVCLVIIGVIWIVPNLQLKRLAKINSDGRIIKASVYGDRIEIKGNDSSWEIKLDNTNRLKILDDIMILYTTDTNQIFVIPTRVINENNEEIIKLIKSGTLKKEE